MMATASPMIPQFVSLQEYRTMYQTPSYMNVPQPAILKPQAPSMSHYHKSAALTFEEDQVCAMLLNLKNTVSLKAESLPQFETQQQEYVAPVSTRALSPASSVEGFSSDASSDRKRYRSGESDQSDETEYIPEPKISRFHMIQFSAQGSAPIFTSANNNIKDEKPKLRRKRKPSNPNVSADAASALNAVNNSKDSKQGAEVVHATHQARWMERFNELKSYREKYGNCNVTFAKEHEHFKTLAYWVSNQRISYRKRNMPLDRVQMLRDIGFDFNQCGRENGTVSPTNFVSMSESGSEGETGLLNAYSPSMKSSKKPVQAPFDMINSSSSKIVEVDNTVDQQNCRRKLFEVVENVVQQQA